MAGLKLKKLVGPNYAGYNVARRVNRTAVFVCYNTGNKEIVDVTEGARLNQCKMFPGKDVRLCSEFLQRYFKTGPPIVVFMWLALVKEKERF